VVLVGDAILEVDPQVDLEAEDLEVVEVVMPWLAQQVRAALVAADMTTEVSQLVVAVADMLQSDLEPDINRVVMVATDTCIRASAMLAVVADLVWIMLVLVVEPVRFRPVMVAVDHKTEQKMAEQIPVAVVEV
jgi:hypothetical protein